MRASEALRRLMPRVPCPACDGRRLVATRTAGGGTKRPRCPACRGRGWRRQAAALLLLWMGVMWLAVPDVAIGAERVRAVDGDTLVVAGGQHIRLSGIDAPELRQPCQTAAGVAWPCGEAARLVLQLLVDRGTVTCEVQQTDRYGRALARCAVEGMDLGAALVRAGLAVAYRRYSMDYVAAEDVARAAKRGMWDGCFTEPEAWRRGVRP
jgi:endonuclease YncB( thermonuclease family)